MDIAKITEADLEDLIGVTTFSVEGTLTICVMDLWSGFKVVGKSACLNPADFDDTIGRDIARADAFGQLWQLEGYHRLRVASELATDEED